MTADRFAKGIIALLLSTTPLHGQRCCAPTSARRVIDAPMIGRYGWHHLAEVVDALPPGTTASIDGFNHSLTGSRVGFMEATGSSASWLVRLDGQPMPVSIGGLWMLDAVPVSLTQIDSIVITEGPAIVDGRATFLGTIELFTRRARSGASVVADYQHGNESGDPGPYRYTSRATPNVEKIGPFASGAVAYGADRAIVDLGARYSGVNITDERIYQRLPTFGLLQQDVHSSGGSGVVTVHAAGGDHFLIGGRERFSGLMHFPIDGSDRATKVITSQIGLTGTAVGEAFVFRYGASAMRHEITPLGTAIPFSPAQNRTIGDAFMEASPHQGLRFGAGIRSEIQDNSNTEDRRHAERAWATYEGSRQMATIAVEHDGGATHLGGALQYRAPVADSETFAVSLTVLRSSADANGAWMDGFGTANTRAASMGIADLRVELTTRRLLGVLPTWYGRAFALSGDGAQSDVNAIAAGFVAATPPGQRTAASVRGEISQVLNSGSPAESSTPPGFIEANGSLSTVGRFLLTLSARYAPATSWPDLGFGAQEVPSTQRVDLSVNKPMWHDRIRAQMVLRNALDVPDRTHPIGAQWDLRTHLAVTIDLPPFPRGTP